MAQKHRPPMPPLRNAAEHRVGAEIDPLLKDCPVQQTDFTQSALLPHVSKKQRKRQSRKLSGRTDISSYIRRARLKALFHKFERCITTVSGNRSQVCLGECMAATEQKSSY